MPRVELEEDNAMCLSVNEVVILSRMEMSYPVIAIVRM